MRGWQDIRKVWTSVPTSRVDDTTPAPFTLNATDVEQAVTFPTEQTGFLAQNLGPNPVYVRLNGTAGTGDNQWSAKVGKNEYATLTDTQLLSISVVCDVGQTAKINFQPLKEPVSP